MRLAMVVLAGCLAALASGGSTGGAISSLCIAAPISKIEHGGVSYRRVQLTLPRQGERLATVQVSYQDYPCYDAGPVPNPRPPLPPPRIVDVPLERLAGIAPDVAMGAADPGFLWVPSSCTAIFAMDVAVSCLGFTDDAAYRAVKSSGLAPFVRTSRSGDFPLLVRSQTTCTNVPFTELPRPVPTCTRETGAVRQFPRLNVQLGENLLFATTHQPELISISYGRQPPRTFRASRWRGWKVTATGKYTLKIIVSSGTDELNRVTTFELPLNVPR